MAIPEPDSKKVRTTVAAELDEAGYGVVPAVLSEAQCGSLVDFYTDDSVKFRKRIDMARYNFGRGEYQYFAYPLPALVQELRENFYALLAPIANDWHERLGIESRWPPSLQEFLRRCHARGQTRPTPLLLSYKAGDYNCLHQDLYGETYFPLQVIIQLSRPGVDFDGGELMLVEQRPRMQSRGMVVRPQQGDAVVIPVRERPRRGSRGYHRVSIRHGVSQLSNGQRFTLGLIFHDAK
jgi:hypothetical protein